MNLDHKAILVDNFTYLVENITLSESTLLDNLLVAHVLEEQEVDEIKANKTEHKKINALLHYIGRTSREQYEDFLRSLKKSSHKHVFIKLGGTRSNIGI